MLDFQNGINADSDKYGNGIKYISVSDILNNPYICYNEIIGLVDIDNSTLEHYKVECGDIVFQRSSETFEDIGHANVYLDKLRPATFGGFVIKRKEKGNYNPFSLRIFWIHHMHERLQPEWEQEHNIIILVKMDCQRLPYIFLK